MVDSFIHRQADRADGLSIVQCLHIFGASKSGYYSWVRRKKDIDSPCVTRKEQQEQLEKKFRKVMGRLGYVPGKGTFQTRLWREFSISIGIKRCREVMKEMNLVANRPRKDAYKDQATHNHEYSSPRNAVKQDLSVGPRGVILTDITYLYYSPVRTPIYLYAFKDAHTKEILGHCVSSHMTASLVKSAHDVMMENHGCELRGAAYVIHSGQGSQCLSTIFQRLLSDDGFLQSVPDRGNSQDNAPTESFFGRSKYGLFDLMALRPNVSTISRMVSGYIGVYDHQHYQYVLTGLTPSEYYTYVTTGIHPVGNYYGIGATELMPIQALITTRRHAAEEKTRKYREASTKKRAMAQGKKRDPEFVIAGDQRILCREITKQTHPKELVLQQTSHLREIPELSRKTRAYLMTASVNLTLQLYNGENWGAHPELAYIYKMRELF